MAVKEAVMPWDRFPEQDSVLGPEMRATGEVMGVGADAGVAYAKALLGAGHRLPSGGTVLLTLSDRDKPMGLAVAQAFTMLGFRVLATRGTARYLSHHAVPAELVNKVGEGPWDTVGRIEAGEVDLVINTPAAAGHAATAGSSATPPAAARSRVSPPSRAPSPWPAASAPANDAITAPKSLQEWLAGEWIADETADGRRQTAANQNPSPRRGRVRCGAAGRGAELPTVLARRSTHHLPLPPTTSWT